MNLPQRSSLVNGAGAESGACCQNGLLSSPTRRQPMEHSARLAGISRQRPSKNSVCRLSENFLNTVCDTIGRFVLVLVLAAARVHSFLSGQQRATLLEINKADGKELRYV